MDIAERLNKERLDDPNVLKEDTPPMLRFRRHYIEDRIGTEETGSVQYFEADMVYCSPYGDNKTAVPYVARTFRKVPHVEKKLVKKLVEIEVEKPDGSVETDWREREVPEDRVTYTTEEIFPWIDQLKERLKHGRISQDYFNICDRAYRNWREKGEAPVEGIPITEWAGVSEAQRKKLTDMGLNSVELVSAMTEDALTEFGMGARDVKTRAIRYLENNSGDRVEQMEKKHASEMSALEEKIAELQAQVAKKPGRKPKSGSQGDEENTSSPSLTS